MKRVLITGANGFVAFYLIEQLLKHGYQVLATGKGPCRLPYNGPHFQYESLDFTEEDSVSNLVSEYRPEVLVHAGALSKPDQCEQDREMARKVNVEGTNYLLKAAAEIGCHFIFLSTDFVFSGDTGMYAEDDLPGPVNYYGQTKLEAEALVRAYHGQWSIVRTVLVYGQPQLNRHNILSSSAMALREGRELRIFTDQWRTPTFVKDLAWALYKIIELQKEGVYHISGPDGRTPYQMVVEMAAALQLDQTLVKPVIESEFDQPARRPPRTGFNLAKARKELGYQPTPFSEGLKQTFQEFEKSA